MVEELELVDLAIPVDDKTVPLRERLDSPKHGSTGPHGEKGEDVIHTSMVEFGFQQTGG